MPKRHDNLFSEISSFASLRRASKKAVKGKRGKRGGAAYLFALEHEILRLQRDLETKTYQSGRYVEIELKRPKRRLVSAAPMRDRVVQHALIDIVGPIFEKGFIDNSFANRVGKGSHRAITAYERFRSRHAYVLRCDIFRYFPAIDHEILKTDFRRRIACHDTLWLMDTIIDGSNAQEPVNRYFPGDDLLTPMTRRRGLPIGNLMSQFSANLYLEPLDHFVTEVLQAGYVRYVDDFAVFHDDLYELQQIKTRIQTFLNARRLKLHPRKTVIVPTNEPAEFLGFILYPDGKRALTEDNVRAFKGRLKGMLAAVKAGTLSVEKARERIAAWEAHASHAHSYAARRAILGRAKRKLRYGT